MDEYPEQLTGPRRRGLLRGFVVFVIISVALYLLLPGLAHQHHVFALMRSASGWWLALAVACEVTCTAGYSLLFQWLARILGIRIGYWLAFRINLAGQGISHVFSAGGVGGAVVTYNGLRRYSVTHARTIIVVIAQNFVTYLVLWFFFLFAMAYLVLSGEDSSPAYFFALVWILFLVGLTGYGIWMLGRPTRFRRTSHAIIAFFRRVLKRKLLGDDQLDLWVDGILDAGRMMRARHSAYPRTVVYAASYWLFDILCLIAVFAAFGRGMQLAPLLIGYVIAYTVATFTPTPGGLGAVEGIMIALYAGFGVPGSLAVAIVLTYRLINFWLPIPFGLLCYVTLGHGAVE